MNIKNISAYISQADGDFVSVKNIDQNIRNLLADIGLKNEETDNNCKIYVASDADKAQLME